MDDFLRDSEYGNIISSSLINTIPSKLSEYLYSKLTLNSILSNHSGCVNSLDFNGDSTLLLSASDDMDLCIWSCKDWKLIKSHSTGHTSNIFSARWMSNMSYIVTGAGDAEIRLFSLEWNSKMIITLKSIYKCHIGRVKKIEIIDNDRFVSCSEDGTVRLFSLSQPHECNEMTRSNGCKETLLIDASHLDISIQAIASSPLRSEILAIGSNDCIIRIYNIDQLAINDSDENLTKTFYIWTPAHTRHSDLITDLSFSQNSLQLLATFINDQIYLLDLGFDASTIPISSLSMNSSSVTSPSLSYLSNSYREKREMPTNVDKELVLYQNAQTEFKNKKYQSATRIYHRLIGFHATFIQAYEWKLILGLEYINRSICYILIGKFRLALEDLQRVFNALPKDDDTLSIVVILSAICAFLIDREGVGLLLELASKVSLIQDSLINQFRNSILEEMRKFSQTPSPSNKNLIEESLKGWLDKIGLIDIPFHDHFQKLKRNIITGYHHRYKGHLNVQTTKGIHFLGPIDDFIASGSDSGHFFIWNKNSEKLIFVGKSDNHIVNQIKSCPSFPFTIIASGIDNDIKVWKPMIAIESSLLEKKSREIFKKAEKEEINELLQRATTNEILNERAEYTVSRTIIPIPCNIQ